MTVLYALLAALANALNVTTQHKASIASPKPTRGWRLVLYLCRNPLWLFGWIALVGAFVFQALALNHGGMATVQPLLVTELVFALVLRRAWLGQTIRAVTWWSAVAACVLLAAFLSVSEPQGGTDSPSGAAWVWACIGTAIVVGLLTALALRGSPARRAALMASATAVMWALVASFIKATMTTLTRFGALGVLHHWPVYALAGAGLAAELLDQVTLHVGPLSFSQPFMVIVDPIVSIALSVWIFDEYFTESPLRLLFGSLSFAGMCLAVIELTRTAPTTMDRAAATASTEPG